AGLAWLGGVSVNREALGFTTVLALASSLAFGLVPALHASGLDLCDSLREGARVAHGTAGRRGFRAGLLVAEVALSFVLLVGAGLMARSLERLLKVDLGFDPSGVLTTYCKLPTTRYATVAEQT